jgi:hypothetical protein
METNPAINTGAGNDGGDDKDIIDAPRIVNKVIGMMKNVAAALSQNNKDIQITIIKTINIISE